MAKMEKAGKYRMLMSTWRIPFETLRGSHHKASSRTLRLSLRTVPKLEDTAIRSGRRNKTSCILGGGLSNESEDSPQHTGSWSKYGADENDAESAGTAPGPHSDSDRGSGSRFLPSPGGAERQGARARAAGAHAKLKFLI